MNNCKQVFLFLKWCSLFLGLKIKNKFCLTYVLNTLVLHFYFSLLFARIIITLRRSLSFQPLSSFPKYVFYICLSPSLSSSFSLSLSLTLTLTLFIFLFLPFFYHLKLYYIPSVIVSLSLSLSLYSLLTLDKKPLLPHTLTLLDCLFEIPFEWQHLDRVDSFVVWDPAQKRWLKCSTQNCWNYLLFFLTFNDGGI